MVRRLVCRMESRKWTRREVAMLISPAVVLTDRLPNRLTKRLTNLALGARRQPARVTLGLHTRALSEIWPPEYDGVIKHSSELPSDLGRQMTCPCLSLSEACHIQR